MNKMFTQLRLQFIKRAPSIQFSQLSPRIGIFNQAQAFTCMNKDRTGHSEERVDGRRSAGKLQHSSSADAGDSPQVLHYATVSFSSLPTAVSAEEAAVPGSEPDSVSRFA